MIYTIGAIVGLLILLLVSFVLNSRRVNKLEQSLEDLADRIDSFDKKYNSLVEQVAQIHEPSVYGKDKADLENDPNFAALKTQLEQVKSEQDNYYQSILNEQNGLKHELSQLKTLLSSLPVSTMAKAAANAVNQDLHNRGMASAQQSQANFQNANVSTPNANEPFVEDDGSGIFIPPGSNVNLPFNENAPLPQQNVNQQAHKLAQQRAQALGKDPLVAMAQNAYAQAQAKGLVEANANQGFEANNFGMDSPMGNPEFNSSMQGMQSRQGFQKPSSVNQAKKTNGQAPNQQNSGRNPSDPLGMGKNRNHNSNFTQAVIGSEQNFAQDVQANNESTQEQSNLPAQHPSEVPSVNDFSFDKEHSLDHIEQKANDGSFNEQSQEPSIEVNSASFTKEKSEQGQNVNQRIDKGFAVVDIPVDSPSILIDSQDESKLNALNASNEVQDLGQVEPSDEQKKQITKTLDQANSLAQKVKLAEESQIVVDDPSLVGHDDSVDLEVDHLKQALSEEHKVDIKAQSNLKDIDHAELDSEIKEFTNKINAQEADSLSKDLAHDLEQGLVSSQAFTSSIKDDVLKVSTKEEFNADDFTVEPQKTLDLDKHEFDLAEATDELRFDALDSFTRLYTNARKKQLEKEQVVKEAQELKKVAALGNFNQKEDFEKSLKSKLQQKQHKTDIDVNSVSYEAERLTDQDYASFNKSKPADLKNPDLSKDNQSDYASGFSYTSRTKEEQESAYKQDTQNLANNRSVSIEPKGPVVNMIIDEDYVKRHKDKRPNGIDFNTLGKVRAFIEAGISLEEIAATTGLSPEELSLLYDVDESGNNKPAKLQFEGKLDESIQYENDGQEILQKDLNKWDEQKADSDLDLQLKQIDKEQINDLKVIDHQSDKSLLETAVKDDKPYLALDSDEKKTIAQMMEDSTLEQNKDEQVDHDNEEQELEQKLGLGIANSVDSSYSPTIKVDLNDLDDDSLNEEASLKDALAKKGVKSKLDSESSDIDSPVEDEVEDLVNSLRKGTSAKSKTSQNQDNAKDSNSLQSSNFVDHLNEEELQELGLEHQGSITATYLDSMNPIDNLQDLNSQGYKEKEVEGESEEDSLAHSLQQSRVHKQSQVEEAEVDQPDEIDELAASLIEGNDSYQKAKEQNQNSLVSSLKAEIQAQDQSDPLNILGEFKKHKRASQPKVDVGLENNAEYLQDLNQNLDRALDTDEDYVDLNSTKKAKSAKAKATAKTRTNAKTSNVRAITKSSKPLGAGSIGNDNFKNVASSIDPLASMELDDSYAKSAPLALGSLGETGASSHSSGSISSVGTVGSNSPRYNRNAPRQQGRFSNVSSKNPGMSDMIPSIDNGDAGFDSGDEDPAAVLSKVLNSGLNSVSELSKDQLDTLNQLQQPMAKSAQKGQHFANLQARNAYGINKS